MGFIADLISPPKMRVSDKATRELEGTRKGAKRARASLFKTKGGVKGEELEFGQVEVSDKLFGN